jgi:glutamate-1-semialdehyde 2,1-aminomutase
VRAFGAVGGAPVFFEEARGAWLVDVDGRRYVDHVLSWGAIIAGHAHPRVIDAVRGGLGRGLSAGAPSADELALAERIRAAMPSIERIRMVTSGTEAVMTALRLARAHTGRDGVIKFRGCYHGHSDPMLVRAGSGVATLGLPDSAGVTRGATADTLVAEFNDLDSVRRLLDERPDRVGAVIVEPVAGNMGLVLPDPDFLPGLRALTAERGVLLIFDEVMTGFRVGPGGAQGRFGVAPDVTTLGKVIGGGLSVGAVGGRKEIMSALAPSGPVYQAGTLSGHPLAMRAGLAVLACLDEEGAWERLERAAQGVAAVLTDEAERAGVALQARSLGAMFGFFFADGPVRAWPDAERSDRARFRAFFHAMLGEGIYLAPSPFEAGFVSLAHGDAELAAFGRAVRSALARSGRRAAL